MLPITIRNRTITDVDLTMIQAVVHEHWDKGRTAISRILCQKWNWRQPNGALKDMACREVLLTLERSGHLKLPPAMFKVNNKKRNRPIPVISIDQTPIVGQLSDFGEPTIKLVRHTEFEPLYNSLVQHHHYLGYRQIVGSHLKYMAFLGDRPVACLGWDSAVWSVKCRDAFIGWDKPTKRKNLPCVVNNTRFLLLPWVSLKYLASKLLALNARRIAHDWMSLYQQPVYLLETFVEKDRFLGTCYKAANWQLCAIAHKIHYVTTAVM